LGFDLARAQTLTGRRLLESSRTDDFNGASRTDIL
jgi:hypothetical protein